MRYLLSSDNNVIGSACEPFSIPAAASRARRRLRQGRANAGKIARRRARLLRARWLRKGHDAPDRDTGRREPAGAHLLFRQKGRALSGPRPIYRGPRSEEHTSELQSLMSHSYAVVCLKITG